MSLQQQLIENLNSLSPSHLEIINESSNHGGYYPGKESHFKVVIVSEAFDGLRPVQRHQKVYACTQSLLAIGGGDIHALALHTYTASEWVGQFPVSPNCAHTPKG